MNLAGREASDPSRWLQQLRQRVAEQIDFCHLRLDDVTEALEDEHQGGPIPVEARMFFAADAAVDLLRTTRYLQRAAASCGTETVRRLGDMVFLDHCTRSAAHEGDCDPDASSLMRQAEAAAYSLARTVLTVADKASEVALRLDQASADGTRRVSPADLTPLREVAQDLGTIADGARVLGDELRRAEAQLVADRPSPQARLALAREQGPGADAPADGLGGHG